MIATIPLSRCLLRPVAPYGSLAEVYLRQKMPKSWKGLPWRRSGLGIYSFEAIYFTTDMYFEAIYFTTDMYLRELTFENFPRSFSLRIYSVKFPNVSDGDL
jgi:hypothetical protein